MLKSICEVLDLERSGVNSELVARILNFLMHPKPSGKVRQDIIMKLYLDYIYHLCGDHAFYVELLLLSHVKQLLSFVWLAPPQNHTYALLDSYMLLKM